MDVLPKEGKRKVNWSKSETNALVTGYIDNFSVLEGKFTPKNTHASKNMTWKTITLRYCITTVHLEFLMSFLHLQVREKAVLWKQ